MDIHQISESDFQEAYGIQCAPLPPQGGRDGLYPTFCRVPAGGKTTRHAHSEPELFFIMSGRGFIEIGNERKDLHAGDLVQIPPFSQHQLSNSEAIDLVFLSVYSEDFEVPMVPAQVRITAAPPTPNGPLHLGHISGPYLASDIVSRYLRLRHSDVRSHSGTDDHQNYVSERALSLGIDSETFRSSMRARIQEGLRGLQIRFDEFIEPKSEPVYQAQVLDFAEKAIHSGCIELETLDLPYCEHCEHALLDSLIQGSCPVCNEPSSGGCENCGIVVLPSALLNASCSRCHQIATQRKQLVHTFNLSRHLHLIRADLRKLSLSPRLQNLMDRIESFGELKVLVSSPTGAGAVTEPGGGLQLPGSNQNLHVWFEMAAHYANFSMDSRFWVHCFGFDNSFHYLLYIPTLLRAVCPQAKLPDVVVINEFLLLEGHKFSTSRDHAIWADEFDGDTDHLRLYLSLHRPHRRQIDFLPSRFRVFSKELETQVAGLRGVARGLGSTPDGHPDTSTVVQCARLVRDMEYFLAPQNLNFRQAAHRLLGFMDEVTHASDSESNTRLMLRALASVMAPLMPTTSTTLFDELQEPRRNWGDLGIVNS